MEMDAMRRYCGALLLLFSYNIVCETIKLPTNFYTIKQGKATQTITIKDNFIFFVVVPDTPTRVTKQPEKLDELNLFMKDITIPSLFFDTKTPNQEITPITLFLDWEEQENTQIRKRAAQELASGIDSLKHKFKDAKFILLGHGQGGNVINHASKQVQKPLDVVISLSTPIFPHSATASSNESSSDYLPDEKKIGRLFCFYSEQDFSLAHPTLHPKYQHLYLSTIYPSLSNVLLLINNKHPITQETLRPLVGKRILQLCKKIIDSYSLHNNFIAHLSTTKTATDMVVFLRDTSTTETEGNLPQQIAQERMLSEIRMQKFAKDWGRPLAISLTPGEKSRKGYEGIQKATETSRG